MTAPLEVHYRRLLAIYPAAHRRAYEEEMVGVLMAGAEPGQRRPALGEAADLLWGGLRARLGRGAQSLRTSAWRDAAAVAALFGAVLLAAAAGRRLIVGLTYFREYDDPMRFLGIDGGLLIDVAARTVAWLAVVVAVLLAARRTAVALAGMAVLVEIAAIAVWQPSQEFRAVRMSWALALALLTVALLVLSRPGRPARATLGRRGGTLITAGLALAAVSALLLPWWPAPPQILGLLPVTDAMLLAAGAMLLAGLQRIPAGTRRRILVLLAAVVAVPIAQRLLEQAIGIPLARSVTPGIVVVDVLLMVGVPLLAFALAAAVLHLRETVRVTVSRVPEESPSV
ncbi:hypothetical protein GCM10020358_24440 [Amorphoplanes nipponensis]|uniref:LigA protein n=1 Tax=Actinoplanes nipponensis TaxID=135950 RepID=A0A919MQA6_9ACTN|nr:hypothetical protein [Actinoplanes nipponensis]GIE53451.1 hypothetical protein Ani05nite_69850 [Actinoplanes nipponensis]